MHLFYETNKVWTAQLLETKRDIEELGIIGMITRYWQHWRTFSGESLKKRKLIKRREWAALGEVVKRSQPLGFDVFAHALLQPHQTAQ